MGLERVFRMLLYRFPWYVAPDSKSDKTICLIVSMYRKSVDGAYQKMIEDKVNKGAFDEYLVMMLHNILNAGKEKTVKSYSSMWCISHAVHHIHYVRLVVACIILKE